MKLAIHYSYNEVVQTVECDAHEVQDGILKLLRKDGTLPAPCLCNGSCDCPPRVMTTYMLVGMVRDFQFIEVMP